MVFSVFFAGSRSDNRPPPRSLSRHKKKGGEIRILGVTCFVGVLLRANEESVTRAWRRRQRLLWAFCEWDASRCGDYLSLGSWTSRGAIKTEVDNGAFSITDRRLIALTDSVTMQIRFWKMVARPFRWTLTQTLSRLFTRCFLTKLLIPWSFFRFNTTVFRFISYAAFV